MGYYVLKKSAQKPHEPKTLLGSFNSQQYYFVLKASNGETIAQSEMYSSKQAAQNGIRSCQLNGSTTDIRDET